MAALREAASGLPTDGHAMGISPEGGDVASQPAQGLLLVHEAVVAGLALGRRQRRVGQGPEHAQAVVDGDHDDAGLADEVGAVVLVGAAVDQAATMDPHIHRQPLVGSGLGRTLHVEEQTILGERQRPVGAR